MNELTIVGVGTSAGGLGALRQLLKTIPSDTPISLVVVQHLEPNHESLLADILGRNTQLTVKQANEDESIEPGFVYVIPPNRYMSVDGTKIALSESPSDRLHRMPVDHLFTSIAESMGSRGIGVVLTGTGSDGTGGVQAIQERGGLTIAQDPREAEYDGMPRNAINSGAVDHVLPVEGILDAILYFREHQEKQDRDGTHKADHDGLESILGLVQARGGPDFTDYKRSSLARRIQRRMGLVHAESMDEYRGRLESEPEELRALTRDLLISVTRFFRDEEAFQSLEDAVSELLDDLNENDHRDLRAWVPGCATGEEAYSIAIVLLEQVRKRGISRRVQVFGSDIDTASLETARDGRYGGYISGQMPAEYLKRYFVELESGYRVSKPLREAVLFSPQNLLTDPPFSGLDLVSCRNVLIYLHRDTHDRLFGVFHFALNDGGLLFMGNAESIGSHEALFKTVDRPNHVYQKRSDTSAAANRTGFRSPAHHVLPTGQYRTRTRPNTSAEAATTRTIADVFGPAAIAVDADDKVRYLHGDANRYLALPSGEPRYELSKLLKTGLSARVMAAIRSVRDGHDQFDESVTFREESKWRSVRLVVRPTSTAPGLLMVAFEERGELPASEENIDSSSAEAEIIESLEKELETTRAELSTTVEEMESANEELKASNEEVLSMNEELQSTNEELETSKEEMQSLNEELTTVNSELEDKVTQLEHTNRDLESLLESSDLPILFFDSELRLRRYSERASGAFGLISTDIGRPFDSLPSRLTETVPEGHFAQARFASEPNQAEITDPDGSTFLLRVVPHRDDENNMSGVVATFTDVTELRKARDDLASSLERYRSLAENSTDIIARFDKEHRHLFVNRHIENVVEVATEDFLGKTNRELGFPAELCDLWDNRIDAALRSGQPQHAQFSVEDRYGERRIYDWTVTPEKRQGDQTVLAVAREVTELERARENLEKALADRDVLIRDVHHRVKNNLFLLVGLLMMERQKLTKLLEDPEPVVQSMDKLMARVRVISTIYSYLYESTGEAEWVHARQFVTGLTDLVRAAYAEHPVDLTVHCDDVHLPVDTSIPVGLIINEALTNAYKHAFPDGRSGNITVELVDLEDGKIRLSVEDDGIGFPEDSTQSIGQSLIHTLANQIDGSIEQTTDDGVTITIMFPVPEEEDRGQSYHS